MAARIPADRDRHRAPRWMDRVHDHIHERFLEPMRTEDLAQLAGVHPVHLARTFRARYRTTLGAYVRGLRLDWAARRLESGEEPISEIALRAGFADQSHFTRAFRSRLGVTPARYRQIARG
jgi:AraC family transcriptional regulator